MVGEWGVAKQFRDVARAIRPGPARDDHLHIRHDGRAEGRDADACERSCPTSSPPVRCSTLSESDVGLSFLPLSHAFERDGRHGYTWSPAFTSSSPNRSTRSDGTSGSHGRRCSPACRVSTRSCMPASWKTVRTHQGCRARSFVGPWALASRSPARRCADDRRVRSIDFRPGWRTPRSAEGARAAWRPDAVPRVRQRSAGEPTSPSSSAHSACRSSKATA